MFEITPLSGAIYEFTLGTSFECCPRPTRAGRSKVKLSERPGAQADIPLVGPVLFNHNILVYLSYVMVAAVWWFLYRTRPGLALRAAGERPSAVDVAGWSVFRIRYLAVIFGAGMAGLAGAFLSVAYLNSWAEGMTAGRGWVALALVIFAGWHPVTHLLHFARVEAA